MPGILAGLLEENGFKLTAKKIIILALVHEDMQFFFCVGYKRATVVLLPFAFVIANVITQGFFSPGAIYG